MIYILRHAKIIIPSGVHISEAGASVISDIILDYVKSPVEGEYTTPNTKKRIRSSTSTPGSTDKQQSKIPKQINRNCIRHE
jgi:hypothetical protein